MAFQACPRGHTEETKAAPESILCGPCIKEVERNLCMLPALHRECLHHITPTPRRLNPTKVSGTRRRDHLNVSALDARSSITSILESWSDVVEEKIGAAVPGRSVPQLARFLVVHLRWLAAQPPAADFADEIENLRVESLRAIEADAVGEESTARDCFVDGCTGSMNTTPENVGSGRGSSISCSLGHSWPMREWLALRNLMNQQRKAVA